MRWIESREKRIVIKINYRFLAATIIEKAFEDLKGNKVLRSDAMFLFENKEWLNYLCDTAGVDRDVVYKQYLVAIKSDKQKYFDIYFKGSFVKRVLRVKEASIITKLSDNSIYKMMRSRNQNSNGYLVVRVN